MISRILFALALVFGLGSFAAGPVQARNGVVETADCNYDDHIQGTVINADTAAVRFVNVATPESGCTLPVTDAWYRTTRRENDGPWISTQTYLGHKTEYLAPGEFWIADHTGLCIQADRVEGLPITDGAPYYDAVVAWFYHWTPEECAPSTPEPSPPTVEITPTPPTVEITPTPTPPTVEITPEPTIEPTPEPPTAEPTPPPVEPTPSSAPEPSPEVTPAPEPTPTETPQPTPAPTNTPEPTPTPPTALIPPVTAEPTPEPTPEEESPPIDQPTPEPEQPPTVVPPVEPTPVESVPVPEATPTEVPSDQSPPVEPTLPEPVEEPVVVPEPVFETQPEPEPVVPEVGESEELQDRVPVPDAVSHTSEPLPAPLPETGLSAGLPSGSGLLLLGLGSLIAGLVLRKRGN